MKFGIRPRIRSGPFNKLLGTTLRVVEHAGKNSGEPPWKVSLQRLRVYGGRDAFV
jgi:hypothetical protein